MTPETLAIEWYVPRRFIDAAVQVMGGIDLDPATYSAAEQYTCAKRFYTNDDGLSQRWTGRVFVNPPRKTLRVRAFVAKLLASWLARDVSEAIVLVDNATDTMWFHDLAKHCTRVCLTNGRIAFVKVEDGVVFVENQQMRGQAFFYFGANIDRFSDVFSEFGAICRVVSPARGRCPKAERRRRPRHGRAG